MRYPIIDVKQTGKRIREACGRQGVCTKDIQEFMNFSAVQSVYNWFCGKSLPSLDNFYALSRLLGMPMEKLIVTKEPAEYELSVIRGGRNREILAAYRKYCQSVCN